MSGAASTPKRARTLAAWCLGSLLLTWPLSLQRADADPPRRPARVGGANASACTDRVATFAHDLLECRPRPATPLQLDLPVASRGAPYEERAPWPLIVPGESNFFGWPGWIYNGSALGREPIDDRVATLREATTHTRDVATRGVVVLADRSVPVSTLLRIAQLNAPLFLGVFGSASAPIARARPDSIRSYEDPIGIVGARDRVRATTELLHRSIGRCRALDSALSSAPNVPIEARAAAIARELPAAEAACSCGRGMNPEEFEYAYLSACGALERPIRVLPLRASRQGALVLPATIGETATVEQLVAAMSR